ncbi:hypothetical protein PENSUB_5807 [Penicillium subrubescens]|uniref:Transmembrane protein n=1 Tax=Penicillium subrubescens TaxID=1316194 RepID=A0A1Q5U5E1_9EURO|nr:hypothetical protein PENSUB_5807 [Penicillium subrubescens]
MGRVLNCSFSNGTFDADLDVVTTAWCTFIVAIISYFTRDCLPPDVLSGADWVFSPILDKIPTHLHRPKVVQNVMLILGDLQLVTGTSIYLVAYSRHSSITQYHFNIAVLQAQIALAMYTIIALATRDILRKSWYKRFWRWPWVFTICIADIISSFIIWDDGFLKDLNWGLPMQCAWRTIGHYSGNALVLLILDVFTSLSDISYATALFFPSSERFNFLQQLPDLILELSLFSFKGACRLDQQRMTTQSSLLRAAMTPITKTLLFLAGLIFIIVLCVTDIFTSRSFQILLSYIKLMSNSALLVALRQNARNNGMEGDENSWGFGQILPLLLLTLPIFQTMEMVLDRKDTGLKESRRSSSCPSKKPNTNEESSAQNQQRNEETEQSPARESQETLYSPSEVDLNLSTPLSRQSTLDALDQITPQGGRQQRVDTEMGRSILSDNTRVQQSASGGSLNLFEIATDNSLEAVRDCQNPNYRKLSIVSVGIVYLMILILYHYALGTERITSALTDNPVVSDE